MNVQFNKHEHQSTKISLNEKSQITSSRRSSNWIHGESMRTPYIVSNLLSHQMVHYCYIIILFYAILLSSQCAAALLLRYYNLVSPFMLGKLDQFNGATTTLAGNSVRFRKFVWIYVRWDGKSVITRPRPPKSHSNRLNLSIPIA